MREPTREEQVALVKQWEETGPELERIRREALKGMPYNWRDVDELLRIGDQANLPSRTTSGLVEMQRLFMKGHSRLKKSS